MRANLGVGSPPEHAQEQLKFLMCLDYKYLEVVLLNKLDKIMQDIDYISVDLLRRAQDRGHDATR